LHMRVSIFCHQFSCDAIVFFNRNAAHFFYFSTLAQTGKPTQCTGFGMPPLEKQSRSAGFTRTMFLPSLFRCAPHVTGTAQTLTMGD
jgi:hypothetical protein